MCSIHKLRLRMQHFAMEMAHPKTHCLILSLTVPVRFHSKETSSKLYINLKANDSALTDLNSLCRPALHLRLHILHPVDWRLVRNV